MGSFAIIVGHEVRYQNAVTAYSQLFIQQQNETLIKPLNYATPD